MRRVVAQHPDACTSTLTLMALTRDAASQRVQESTGFVKPELFAAAGLPMDLPTQHVG